MITIRLSANGFRITHIQDRDHHSAAQGVCHTPLHSDFLLEFTLCHLRSLRPFIRIRFFVTFVLFVVKTFRSLVLAQHRAAAAPRAAQAGMFALGFLGVLLADLQIVVVGELFAGTNIAARFDKHAMIFFLDLAVGRARVIDPARRIARRG